MSFDRSARFKSIVFFTAAIMMVVAPLLQADEKHKSNHFETLQKKLVHDGFDPDVIEKLFAGDRLSFDAEGVSLFLRHSEATLNYDQFLSSKNIRKARNYMKTHETELNKAQQRYGVDKCVITAIILVETKLGSYLGKRSIFNTLSSMAVVAEPDLLERVWSVIPEDRRYTREKFENRANRKANWAYQELVALIRYAEREQIDPINLKGSYAGAMGVAQFMPTSVMAYAKDGDNDGKIDLFTHADSIFSIASYLKNFGWRPGIDKKQAYKVVFNYNRSKYYVSAVLKIADRLKGE